MILLRRVHGNSMQPTLQPSRLIVGITSKKPRIGDIVIIRHNGIDKIKRVHKLEDRKMYLVGDNASESTDSRQFGWVPIDDNQVWRVIFPFRIRRQQKPSQ